jgi:hypothetical protein
MDTAKHLVIMEDLIRVMLEDLWLDYVGAYGKIMWVLMVTNTFE